MAQPKDQTSDQSFHLKVGQKLLALITLCVLVVMTFSTFNASQVSAQHSEILNAAEKTSISIISAQREAFEYIVEIKQWSKGKLPKSEVEVERASLFKHLDGFDSSGRSIASLVDPSFIQALRAIDGVIQSSPQGLLPIQYQEKTRSQIAPDLEKVIRFATDLVLSFQKDIEVKLRAVVVEREKVTTRNLWLRYILLLMLLILITWVSATFSARNRFIQNSIKTQMDNLSLSEAELGVALLAITELRDLDDEKNEFISNINHELRTPLTSIIGYLDLVNELTDYENNPEIAKFLKIVDRNLLSLLDLVENMLTISKLGAASSSQSYSRIGVDEIIKDTIFVLQPLLDGASIAIDFAAVDSQGDWSLAGNKGQISQVFINLIQNSVKFSPRNSKIHVEILNVLNVDGKKFVRVSVSDQGIGISAEDIKKLFYRFFRAETAVLAQIPGTGLGLSIVKKIIEQHGGQISVESEINIGTVVHVDLPVFVKGVVQHIQERRVPVLEKAIESISNASLEALGEVADEMGGAIASYTFKKEGTELIQFSKWLAVSPNLTEEEINTKRDAILLKLRISLLKIELGLSNHVE